MKLQHLPVGARFEYEGKIFVKTGPLTAASEEGGQRVIPRYAVLKPLDLPAAEERAASPAGRLDRRAVRTAFEAFYAEALRLTDATAHAELAAARERFLGALK